MICTTEDFATKELNIPNLDRLGDTFTDFVDFTEDDLLRRILGHTLYEAFIADLEENEVDYMEEIHRAIYNGGAYSFEGCNFRYNGLKAILAPYVKSQWLTYDVKRYTGAGVTTAKAENSVVENPSYDIVTLHNKARRLVGDECRMANSFYGYMYVNRANYPDWTFKKMKSRNEFDL